MTDQFINIEVDGYKIIKRCGVGQIGSVYLGEKDGEIRNQRAIKFIVKDQLRDGWQNEINKVTQLHSTDGVVPYIAHDEINVNDIQYLWIGWRYIKGTSLRKFLQEGKITIPLLKDIISIILSVLHACQTIGIQHGDLHSGNILVEDPNDMYIDSTRRKIWVTDFGYLTASMGKAMLDDIQGLSRIISDCIEAIDFHELEGDEKYVYSKLKNDYIRNLNETNPTEGHFVRSPRNLLDFFHKITQLHPEENSIITRKVGDYLVAENLGERYEEWKTLFVPNFVGSERLISKNICVVTGLRGCGKTMVFRRLTGIFDYHLGVSEVEGSDTFIGFYFNARAIAEAFPWIPVNNDRRARNQIIHYFHVCWVCEIIDWLSCISESNDLNMAWLISFLIEYYGDDLIVTGQNNTILLHLQAFFTKERRNSKLSTIYQDKQWQLSEMDFLEKLCSQLKKNVSQIQSKDIFFFLDDYSTPLVSVSAQKILNTVIFRRSPELLFKIATESVESIELVGLNEKYLEEEDDYLLIDWATEIIQRNKRDNVFLVEELLAPRLQWDTRLKDTALNIEKILGKTPYKNTELAEKLRSDSGEERQKIYYHGMQTFCDMWSSSTREMIKIFAELLENVDLSKCDDGKEPYIDKASQNRVLRNAGSKFKNLLVSAIDPTRELYETQTNDTTYGEHLQAIVDAFSEIAEYELQNKRSKNLTTNPPKQARRLEITDVTKSLPEDIIAYYIGLIRYGVFIRDWRGKSVRGKAVPRLYLRSVLIPYYTLTFSKRDSVTLEWDEFCELLSDPITFSRKWINKDKGSKTPQTVMEL